jgi:hypothetical protein
MSVDGDPLLFCFSVQFNVQQSTLFSYSATSIDFLSQSMYEQTSIMIRTIQ